jgi:hypothetical protein
LMRWCSRYDEHWRKCILIFEGIRVVIAPVIECRVFVADRQIKKSFIRPSIIELENA